MFNNKNWSVIISSLILSFFNYSCSNEVKSTVETISPKIIDTNQTKKVDEDKSTSTELNNEKLTFNIPPPTGPGTGVCEVTLKIDNNTITGIETCGGHDENGRTESSDKIFSIPFKTNYMYKVSNLFDTKNGNSLGCDFFEIKSSKLYLYNNKKEILSEWFCIYGNTSENMINEEKCDCIFLPSKY
jgi:hypothetical protein